MDEKRGSGERGARDREGVGLGASPSGYGEYVMGYALGTLHPPHTAAVDGGNRSRMRKRGSLAAKVHAKYGMYISIHMLHTCHYYYR